MPEPSTLRNFRDSFVNENKPKKNFNSLARLRMRADAGDRMWVYMYWGRPYPEGTNIINGKLYLWNAKAIAGECSVIVQPLTEGWGGNKVTWEKKPEVGAASYQATKTNAAAGSMWEIDVEELIQNVANGAAWYGVRIRVTGAGLRVFHSAQSDQDEYRPMVVIEWTDNPEPPDDLSPNNNRAVSLSHPTLSYTFTDVSGDTQLSRHQIQVATDDEFTNLVWDSGWLDTTVPQIDLSTTSFPGLANDESVYWRVRVEDGAGGQSLWSEAAQFKRVTKGVFNQATLVSNGDGTWSVFESTPPISWSLTGRTQSAYRAFIFDTENPKERIYDSGKISGTDNHLETGSINDRVLKRKDIVYRLVLRVWDTIDREATPGDPIVYEFSEDFTYRAGGATAPVNLSASVVQPWPWVDLTFNIPTGAPDSITVMRNDEVVEANIEPGDIFNGGTEYTYRDRLAPPRVLNEWTVISNVNGEDSPSSSSVTAITRPLGTFMMNPDSSMPICIVKSASEPTPVVDAQSQSFQEVHKPVGGSSPVLITQYIAGYEGKVEGVLSDGIVGGLTAAEMKRRFKKWKANPGTEVLLFMVDEVLKVVPMNMTYRPRAKSGGKIIYDISFDFFQVDYR